jgi:hypothetical protein
MVYAATDDRTVGELCPISRSAHTCITRPHMENAIRVAAKRLVLSAPIHAVSHALSQRNIEKSTGLVFLYLCTVPRMARDFNVNRLSDEFRQHLLYLKCSACGHERQTYPRLIAHLYGWDATLRTVEKRLRCSKCGKKACHVRAAPIQKPRGMSPAH